MRSSASWRLSLAFVALLPALSSLPVLAAAPAPREFWIGLYFNGHKIGYSCLRTRPASFRGRAATEIQSTSVARIEMLGNRVTQDSWSTTYADRAFNPIYQAYRISSNGSTLQLSADYRPGKVVCSVRSGGSATKRVLPVPRGANLAVDSSNVTQGKNLSVGGKATLYYLNPLTITLDKTEVQVIGREQVTLNGRAYMAMRVDATTPFGKLVSWETSGGEMLKGDLPFGMAAYSEPKAVALNLNSTAPTFAATGARSALAQAYKPPADLALATAITTDKPITAPRLARELSMTLSGVENKALLLSDSRQSISPESDGSDAYALKVTADRFDAARSVRLPIREPSVQVYLRAAPYLEIQDPEIRKAAAALRGRDTNAYRVATRIRQWVHGHMRPDYTIGVPRSCSDVYRRRRGVCRDYATLFAGIARAAGIPTRVVGGIVYAEGKFYYHAWAECWVGRWASFDPTMASDFVDATHVKFAQGDVTDMYNVASVVGRLRLHVVSVQ